MEKDKVDKKGIVKTRSEAANANKKKLEDMIIILSEDIREYQRKSKLLGHQNKIVENLGKKVSLKLSENNYEIIQFILNKKKRSNDELNIIKTFLSTMKYLSSMIKILDIDKILYSLSIYLKMERKSKDSILFRFGNKGKKFYILLSGQVTILILKETFVKISFMKFIMHLIMLKILGEDETVKKIIIANHQNRHHLDETTFENLFEKLSSKGDKIIESKNKNKIKEEENQMEEEESEDESHEDIKDIKIFKKDKDKENEEEYQLLNLNSNNSNKRHKTLQLNYLVSNFNGLLNTKNYQYVKTNFNNNLDKFDNYSSIKRLSAKIDFHHQRKSVIQSRSNENSIPFFNQDEEIEEIISYYVYLKETIGNFEKKKISIQDYIQNTYLNSIYSKKLYEHLDKDQERYIIYKYHDIVTKNKGDTFGELALQHEDSKRTATIITNTDCIFGYLTKSAYETCLSEIELKRRKNEVNFIMSFAIFDQMNWISFENKYLNYFKREFYSQNDTIIRQGEKINKIYFIMNGQFEITTNISLGGIYRIIKQKRKDALEDYIIRVTKKRTKIRLSICNNKDIIGLNDCSFYKTNGEEISFVNVTCISSKSIVFTLDANILKGLKKKIPEINENLNEFINKREKVMVDRLITIFNILLKKREIEFNEKLKSLDIKSSKKLKQSMSKKQNLDKKNKKDFNEKIKLEAPLTAKNRLYSANIKGVKPLPKIVYTQKSSKDDMILNYSPEIKSYIFDKNKQTLNTNLEKSSSIHDFGISIVKNESFIIKGSDPIIYSKNQKNKKYKENIIRNLYPSLNKMVNKEFNNLFNWIDNINIISKKKKNSFIIDNDNNNENNKYQYNNDEENQNDINKNYLDNPKKLFENDSLNIINKEQNLIKNIKAEKSNKLNKKKELDFLSLNNINAKNKIYINKISSNTLNDDTKQYYNDKNCFSAEKLLKIKKMSNEAYLKQILGTRYRDVEDEFISYAEKKFMKNIKDYNTKLLKYSKRKVKFKNKIKIKLK